MFVMQNLSIASHNFCHLLKITWIPFGKKSWSFQAIHNITHICVSLFEQKSSFLLKASEPYWDIYKAAKPIGQTAYDYELQKANKSNEKIYLKSFVRKMRIALVEYWARQNAWSSHTGLLSKSSNTDL